jgi:hypothetical protein
MKRHPALIPLSRDHHNGLVRASRLRRAGKDGDASARLMAAREFVEFFRNEEREHLRMRKKSSSRFCSGTFRRSLLRCARHASNTCSSRGSLATSKSPWRPASSIERRWLRRESCLTHWSGLRSDSSFRRSRNSCQTGSSGRSGSPTGTRPAPFGARPSRAGRSRVVRKPIARTPVSKKWRSPADFSGADDRSVVAEVVVTPPCPQAGRLPDPRSGVVQEDPRVPCGREDSGLWETGGQAMISALTPGCVASQAPRQVRIGARPAVR